MNQNNMFSQQSATLERDSIAAEQTRFLVKVYNWMGAGLLLTGSVAWFTSQSEAMMSAIFGNPMIPIGLMIAEIGLVFWMAARIMKMSASTAKAAFLGYSALNGLTLSVIFIVYTQSSITATFFVTAGMFGAMSLYGATTKKDLSGLGSFLFMGLIGIVLASVVNMFMASSTLHWIITYAGVLIFTGLTAYDTQSILRMNILGNEGTEEDTKEAISGALRLYLDFINLFIMLLRIMGDRR